MKKTFLTYTTVVTLLLASCKNNSEVNTTGTSVDTTGVAAPTVTEPEPKPEISIVGTWKLSDMQVDMEIPKGQEQAFEDMKKKMIEATVYNFNEDGTMSFKNHLVKETKGTYTYEKDKVVMFSTTTKKNDTATVDELTANKLVLSSEQGGRKAIMTFSK